MKMIAKFKHFFLFGAGFIAFLCIWFCFLPISSTPLIRTLSVYDCTFGEGMFGGIFVAWLLMIFGLVVALFTGYLFLTNKNSKEAAFLGFGAAILFLASGILYACTGAILGGVSNGVGPILNAILLILSAVLATVGSLPALLN